MLHVMTNGHISATRRPIDFLFGSRGGVFGHGGSNGAISGWTKFKMAAGGHLGKPQTAISQQRVIRSTSLLVLGWGFHGRRIQRRHFRFDQIQDGGRRPSWKTSNGHISATRHPIDFVFGSRVGFSGTADPMAPFPFGPNSRWRPAAILENLKWPHLTTRRPIDFLFGSRLGFSQRNSCIYPNVCNLVPHFQVYTTRYRY